MSQTTGQIFDQAIRQHQAGKLQEAARLYGQVLAREPGHTHALNNFGLIAQQAGHLDIALDSFRRAVAVDPKFFEAHSNLAGLLKDVGRVDEAIAAGRAAVAINPGFAEAHYNLGNALKLKGEMEDAIDSYQRALTLKPGMGQGWYNMANALAAKGKLEDAVGAYLQAMKVKGGDRDVLNNLGNAYRDLGLIEEAINCFRRAIAAGGDTANVHGVLCYSLHFDQAQTADAMFAEHLEWARRYAQPLERLIAPHTNSRDRDRVLRVGYVSADFRQHAVATFLEGILESHDHKGFEVHCYSDVPVGDAVTQRLKSYADAWHDINAMSDADLAAKIRADKVDILVDLGGHTARNRLLMFARKPAPIQVAYLGYCDTTGLSSIDYRITDVHTDPLGQTDRFYTEKLIRLPDTLWCYRPSTTRPVTPLPAAAAGFVTFGSLNALAKVNAATIGLWAKVLKEVPDSRLMFLVAPDGSGARRVIDAFVRCGIESHRLEAIARRNPVGYLELFDRVDVALDPFPFAGQTTACDCLWMGVPVVTLAGQTHVSRAGVSLLENVGLGELVAQSPEQYVQIAVGLAQGRSRLVKLRATLRQRMEGSVIMDGKGITRKLEAAYRWMWGEYCKSEI